MATGSEHQFIVRYTVFKSFRDSNDLQQALPTPKLTTGMQYCKRRMCATGTYSFGIHDGGW